MSELLRRSPPRPVTGEDRPLHDDQFVHDQADSRRCGWKSETAGVSLRDRWPLVWRDLGLFVLAYAVLTAAFTALGTLVTGPLDTSVGAWDRRQIDRFVAARTPRLDEVSHAGSMMSETGVKIVVTLVAAAVMVAAWRRWEDTLLVASALILEASVFITVTAIVGRARPDVLRLDSSPVDSAFPSGHVAAAVVYGAMAIIVARHSRRRWPVVLTVALVVAVSGTVAWARLYRGMHYPSDVVAGVLLGVASLYVTWRIIDAADERSRAVQP
jgi:undecaprenyl-diphosphatase